LGQRDCKSQTQFSHDRAPYSDSSCGLARPKGTSRDIDCQAIGGLGR
jgi:hypothetical protein